MSVSLQRVLEAHQAERHEEAEAGYRELVRQNPRQADAWHLWGVLAGQRNQPDLAIERIGRALHLQPGEPVFLSNLGNVHLTRGALGDAIRCFRFALERRPKDEALIRSLAHVCERQLDAGIAHQKAGRLKEAEGCYRDVLVGQPERADAWHLLGTIAMEGEQLKEADSCIRRAISLHPHAPGFHNSLGALLQKQRRLREAIASYRQALRLNPGLQSARGNLGRALGQEGEVVEAESLLREGLVHNPEDADLAWSLADVLMQQGRLAEAESVCRHSLGGAAGHGRLLELLGRILYRQKRLPEALGCFSQAADEAGEPSLALGWLVWTQAHLALWAEELPLNEGTVRDAVGKGISCSTPFAFLNISDDPFEQRHCAEIRCGFLSASEFAFPTQPAAASEKLRIAYLSPDFRTHPVAQLMADLIEQHDSSRLEIHGVALTGADSGDPWRARILAACDHFHQVHDLSDAEVALRLRSAGIDIAVDLAGHTSGCRPGIFAARAAPVQVNWLGYPGTIGAEFMDYILADATVIPEGAEGAYSEQVVRLPDLYQPPACRALDSAILSRRELGLPEQGFVFCCFNNTWKIRPELFEMWMRLLRHVPGSVLWLLTDREEVQANLRREARSRGVEPERLVFAPHAPLPVHLARHRAADLFLDTFPYNAHTTASDALWAGLPLVTRSGRSFPSRVAASLLTAAGLADLVTTTSEQYEELALRLARHPEQLASVRARLEANRSTAPLFDGDRFLRSLEAAYEQMVRQWRSGRAPASFHVAGIAG